MHDLDVINVSKFMIYCMHWHLKISYVVMLVLMAQRTKEESNQLNVEPHLASRGDVNAILC